MPEEHRIVPRGIHSITVYQTPVENRDLNLIEYSSVGVFLVGLALGVVYLEKWGSMQSPAGEERMRYSRKITVKEPCRIASPAPAILYNKPMPELPEVETIARGVTNGCTATASFRPGSRATATFKTPPARQAKGLAGRAILAVHRTGKHIVFELGPVGSPRSMLRSQREHSQEAPERPRRSGSCTWA